jgi:hypothetical protein|tara:strand:- start:30 stop:236 length:207 start_codon:yes stop_codon:yes gene_type:complete
MHKDEILRALVKKYEAQIAEAKITINIYLSNPVGIGEHPQHLEEIDKLMENVASAEDKLDVIRRHWDV